MIYNVGSGGSSTAEAIQYDNYESGLTADNVQDAIDENANNMGGVRFGIDGDGNYGYYKADGSFIPFKSGGISEYQSGVAYVNVTSKGSWYLPTITFPKEFSEIPTVYGINSNANCIVKVNSVSKTSVQFYFMNVYGTGNNDLKWFAYVPEA